MLILTRKKGQSIIINNQIEIFISAVEGDQVKIGINAPSDITILRKEVWESVQESNKEALQNKVEIGQLKAMITRKN